MPNPFEAVDDRQATTRPSVRHTLYQPVDCSDDHTANGLLVQGNDGQIVLIHRVDPGPDGDHVGNGGYLVKRVWDPTTARWTERETIFDSGRYDDRNPNGGRTNDGRIVLFFRQLDADTGESQGSYYMYSDDGGDKWSEPATSAGLTGIAGTGKLFYNPTIDTYGIMHYGNAPGTVSVLYSDDGRSWGRHEVVAENSQYELAEPAGAWAGEDRIVALVRDDRREAGHPLVQVVSEDNGNTWSPPTPTNIPPNQHWGCAPQLRYDESRDMLLALNTDRYSRRDERNSLFIYTAQPDEIVADPNSWTLHDEIPRPLALANYIGERPLNGPMYGYPTMAPIDDGEYMVIVTDRAMEDGTESADLYALRVSID